MQNSLAGYINANKLTFRKVLLELDKAKLICTSAPVNPARLLNPPTKCQREIMTGLGLTPDAFARLDWLVCYKTCEDLGCNRRKKMV